MGVEPPEFEDHTPYSNKAMGDLLDIDEVIYTVNTVVIPPWQNRIIKGRTSLVLFGTKMNVATEPLKRGDPPLPRDYICNLVTQCIIVGVKRSTSPYTTPRISQ